VDLRYWGGGQARGGGTGRQAGGRTDWQMGSAPDQSISNRVRFGMMTEKKTLRTLRQVVHIIIPVFI
jgi:hypothetical protein